MINFESVDFSEHHPEEVVSFFWRSVYIFGMMKLKNVSNEFCV